MPWFSFGLDKTILDCTGIKMVSVCRGLDLHAMTFLSSVGGQLVVKVEF